jgi:hypothetical protein
MYWRYFMWNFSGRESDFSDAPWMGISDAFSDIFPDYITENKAHNNYLMLPLLLGIIGLFFQARFDPKYFYVTLMLFLMMGVVLILYLNSPPVEPRERDYIYVGSFYAFAIWIGMGVMALSHYLGKLSKNLAVAGILATLIAFPVPLLMATQTGMIITGRDVISPWIRLEISLPPVNPMPSCLPEVTMTPFHFGMYRKWKDSGRMCG